ncbi:Phosphatidylserine decarboxylase proenzyme 2 precursor [Pelomyxa schiedti]|nr:Phosphatidylserine decarboxylase proenzyme 2 precursor [Pelomyxa schiedti]
MCSSCDRAAATLSCQNCGLLCGPCSAQLHAMKVLSWHTPSPLSSPPPNACNNNAPGTTATATSEVAAQKDQKKKSRCAVHKKKLDLFCVKDEVAVCAHCLLLGPHRDSKTGMPHACESLDDAAQRMRRQLDDGRALLSKLGDAVCARKSQLALAQQRVDESCEAVKADVHKLFSQLREELRGRERVLISEIEAFNCEKVTNIKKLIEELDVPSAQIAQSQTELKNSFESHVTPFRTFRVPAEEPIEEIGFYTVQPQLVTQQITSLGIGRSNATYPGYRMITLADLTKEPMKRRIFDVASEHGGAFLSLASFTPSNVCQIQEGYVIFVIPQPIITVVPAESPIEQRASTLPSHNSTTLLSPSPSPHIPDLPINSGTGLGTDPSLNLLISPRRSRAPSPPPGGAVPLEFLPRGLLEIKVIEAKGVLAADLNGLSDPYCIIKFAGKECRSRTIMKTLDPKWDETFHFVVPATATHFTVLFEVWDWDTISSSDFLGKVEFDIGNLPFNNSVEKWLSLEEPKKRKAAQASSMLLCPYVIRELFLNSSGRKFALWAINSPIPPEYLEELYDQLDSDKDGAISWQDLCSWLLSDPLNEVRLLPYPLYIWDMVSHSSGKKLSDAVTSFAHTSPHLKSVEHQPRTDIGSPHHQQLRANCIYFKDRKTGQVLEERIPTYIKSSMRMMYSNWGGRKAVHLARVHEVLKHMSIRQGELYTSKKSIKEIIPFINYHHLNTEEILDPIPSFQCFNEFFYRKLKPGARPVDEEANPTIAVSPADCRMSAFATVQSATRIWIKGIGFTLAHLLGGNEEIASMFSDGSIAIARLSPQDYHRYHSPVDGILGTRHDIDGTYYTVNPMAIRQNISVFTENKRCYMLISTENFGQVCWVSVGATLVGSIQWTKNPGDHVHKGEEIGYFAFGGSTIVLLFQKGKISLDSDLLNNSLAPIETLVSVGNRIGESALASTSPTTPVVVGVDPKPPATESHNGALPTRSSPVLLPSAVTAISAPPTCVLDLKPRHIPVFLGRSRNPLLLSPPTHPSAAIPIMGDNSTPFTLEPKPQVLGQSPPQRTFSPTFNNSTTNATTTNTNNGIAAPLPGILLTVRNGTTVPSVIARVLPDSGRSSSPLQQQHPISVSQFKSSPHLITSPQQPNPSLLPQPTPLYVGKRATRGHSMSVGSLYEAMQNNQLSGSTSTSTENHSPDSNLSSSSSTSWVQNVPPDVARRLPAMLKKRFNIATEVLQTETTYVQCLESIIENFLTVLRRDPKGLSKDEIFHLFANVEVLHKCHTRFRQFLHDCVQGWTDSVTFGSVFVQQLTFLKLYKYYINNHQMAMSTLDSAIKRNVQFREYLRKMNNTPALLGLKLEALLITPVQRIPRYVLLLSDMHRSTPQQHPDWQPLQNALSLVRELAEYTNTHKLTADNIEILRGIESKIENFDIRLSNNSTRKLIRDGPMKINGRSMHMWLLNDIIVLTSTKKLNNKYKYKSTVGLTACSLHTASKSFTLFCAEGVFECKASKDTREVWVSDLKEALSAFHSMLLQNLFSAQQAEDTEGSKGYWEMVEQDNLKKRAALIDNFVSTEETYTSDLVLVLKEFCDPLGVSCTSSSAMPLISAENYRAIAGNLKELVSEQQQFLTELQAIVKLPSFRFSFSEIFASRFESLLRVHEVYVESYHNRIERLDHSIAHFSLFKQWLMDTETTSGKKFSLLLLQPLGRISVYYLFTQELLRYTTTKSEDRTPLVEAISRLQSLTERINSVLLTTSTSKFFTWRKEKVPRSVVSPIAVAAAVVETVVNSASKSISVALLPKRIPTAPRKTLVLDLDGTLVHSSPHTVSYCHFTLEVPTAHNASILFYVMKRPHVEYFLNQVSQWYNVVIFTSSIQEYANPIIDQIDKNHVVSQRLFRQDCTSNGVLYLKDLQRLGKPLEQIILVDDDERAFAQPGWLMCACCCIHSTPTANGLVLPNWEGDKLQDDFLLDLIPFFYALHFPEIKDVRNILRHRKSTVSTDNG